MAVNLNSPLAQAYLKFRNAQTPEAKAAALDEVNQARQNAGLDTVDEAGAETGAAQDSTYRK